MKITLSQLKRIIKEEVQDVATAAANDTFTKGDLKNVSDELASVVLVDLADTVLMTYDNEFYARVLSLLQSRGLVDDNMTSDDFMDEVMNYDNEMLKAAQMKVSQDLASVLANYARKLGLIVTGTISPH